MQSYAVVKAGGKQYTVSPGDILKVELFADKNEGDTVELPVLVTNTESGLQVGAPELAGKATATILNAGRGKKVMVHKWRRTSTYRVRNGHRQGFHAIRIDSIPN